MALVPQVRGAAIAAWLGEPGTGTRRRLHQLGRLLSRRPRALTFFHRVDDPHSHLLAQDLLRRLDAWPVELTLVVVPEPAADADPEPILRESWALADAARLAALRGLDLPAETTSPQPSRVRSVNASLLVERPGKEQLEAAVRLGSALFAGDGNALRQATRELGSVPGQRVGPMLEANYVRLRDAGHYQGGMLHYAGEWYWGVDRLAHLEQRLRGEGVELPEVEVGPSRLPTPQLLRDTDGRVPVELFFSFRSPYAYLALHRLAALAASRPLSLRVRPVLPMVTRGLAAPKLKVLYIAKDAAREAARLGLPFGRICDPLGAGTSRALALHQLAERRGQGLAFLLAASRGIWSEAKDLTSDVVLRELAESVGIGGDDAMAALEDESFLDVARDNRDALYELGLWGVPTMHIGDIALWGQDRIDLIERWLPEGG